MVVCRLRLKVVPNSSRDKVVGWMGEALKIKVKAPPEKGKANAAVVILLAKTLGIATKQISLESGEKSRLKQVLIQHLSLSEVLDKYPKNC